MTSSSRSSGPVTRSRCTWTSGLIVCTRWKRGLSTRLRSQKPTSSQRVLGDGSGEPHAHHEPDAVGVGHELDGPALLYHRSQAVERRLDVGGFALERCFDGVLRAGVVLVGVHELVTPLRAGPERSIPFEAGWGRRDAQEIRRRLPDALGASLRGARVVDEPDPLAPAGRGKGVEQRIGVRLTQARSDVAGYHDFIVGHGLEVEFDVVADADLGRRAHAAVHIEAASLLADRDEGRLDGRAVERAANANPAASSEPGHDVGGEVGNVHVGVRALLLDNGGELELVVGHDGHTTFTGSTSTRQAGGMPTLSRRARGSGARTMICHCQAFLTRGG